MAQPPAYTPVHSFVSDSEILANFPGQALDVEFNDVKATTDAIRTNLALIQRDDGALLNGSVGYDQLSASLQTAGLAPAAAWLTATVYAVGNSVIINGNLYRALIAHTSGVFATDLAAAKWLFVTALPTATAAAIGLGNVDNTSDVNKPVSTAQAASIAAEAALARNASNLSSGTVPVGRISSSGNPYVILVTGQSNFTHVPSLAWVPNTNATRWNNTLGTSGSTGTAFAALSTTTINVVDKLGSDIADFLTTRPVKIINISFSGQAISHWLVGASSADIYQEILNNITPALAAAGVSKIDAFVWWQGESDTANTSYVANWATMIARFQALSWFPQETPVLIFGIAPTSISGDSGSDTVNNYLQTIVGTDSDKRKFVYTGSLSAAGYWFDTLHMTAAGYNAAGAMAARVLLGGGRSVLQNVVLDPVSGRLKVGTGASDLASTGALVQAAVASGGVSSLISSADSTTGYNGFHTNNSAVTAGLFVVMGEPSSTSTIFGQANAGWGEIVTSGAGNNGMLLGTLGATPLILGANNAEVLRVLSAGNVKFTNTANFAANNARTVTISNVGPAAIGATIAKWLTFQDSSGTVSYIPVWQ